MNIGLGAERKMILLIDADAHARALLRKALEAAGFSVGEAATHAEGARTAAQIKPDAILAELPVSADGDSRSIGERLGAGLGTAPCYVVSTASEALMGSVGLHELGIAGVFLKPVETDVIVRTLKARLSLTAPLASTPKNDA